MEVLMPSMPRLTALAFAVALPASALASSDAEWERFAKEVEEKCLEAAQDIFRRPQIAVDPQGTESYGVAIVFGRSKEARERAATICVMDKKTGKVEIGSEMGNDIVRVRRPKTDDDAHKGQQAKKQNDSARQNAADDDGADDE
jgi:hypothetical protein